MQKLQAELKLKLMQNASRKNEVKIKIEIDRMARYVFFTVLIVGFPISLPI
jgi:hypothetical protein